jgi:hypothetical protein
MPEEKNRKLLELVQQSSIEKLSLRSWREKIFRNSKEETLSINLSTDDLHL